MKYSSARELIYAITNSFYNDRDIQTTLDCVCDDFAFVGTERNEHGSNKEEFKDYLEREFKEYSSSLSVEIIEYYEQFISNDFVTIMIYAIESDVPNIDSDLSLRATANCIKDENGWKLKSLHLSTPNSELEKKSLINKLEEKTTIENTLLSYVNGGVAIYRYKKDGNVIADYVSDGLARICGYANPNELFEILNKDAKAIVYEDDYPKLNAELEKSVKDKSLFNCAYRLKTTKNKEVLIRTDGKWIETDLGEDDRGVLYAIQTVVSDEMIRIINDQKRLADLINRIPGGVGIYEIRNGVAHLEYLNDAYYDMLGYNRQERLSYLGSENISAVHPDDKYLMNDVVNKLINGQDRVTCQYRVLQKSGEWFWINISTYVIQRNNDNMTVYATFTDCNELIKTQNTLLNTQQAVNIIADTGKIGLWIYDIETHGVVQLTDQGAYGTDKYVSKLPELYIENKVIYPDDCELFKNCYYDMINGALESQCLVRVFDANKNSYLWMRIFLVRIPDTSKYKNRAIGFSMNVNEEIIQQQLLIEKDRQEQKVIQESKAKDEFLTRMSHDLRTPMNGILGLAELSKDENNLDELKTTISKIKDSGEYLLSLINDTLDYQKIESGKMSLEPKIVKAQDILNSIISIIQPAVDKKNINFKINNINANLNWKIKIDEIRFKQILINLLSNAIKFTPVGGKIEIRYQVLKKEGMLSRDEIIIEDTGIGMSEEFLKNGIFKPFSQEKNEITQQSAGSGLGLSIVKSIVDLMGGEIKVSSKLGVGTKFTIYLDFERVACSVDKKIDNNQKSLTTYLEILNNKNILLAEDHPLNAEIAIRLLNKVGCHVTWSKNGQECLDTFKNDPHQYDAILMDIKMPEMDGLTATKMIRNLDNDYAKTIPIIAMTANAYDQDKRKSIEAGMNDHISKPINVTVLYQTLSSFINQTKR